MEVLKFDLQSYFDSHLNNNDTAGTQFYMTPLSLPPPFVSFFFKDRIYRNTSISSKLEPFPILDHRVVIIGYRSISV